MGVVLDERHEKLRLGGHRGPTNLALVGDGTTIRLKPGVLVFPDIPVGAQVHARVTRPDPQVRGVITPDLGADGGQGVGSLPAGTIQGYRFERAPGPATVDVPGGATVRTLKEVLIPPTSATGGPQTRLKEVPLYVAFAPVQEGDLAQSGRAVHLIPLASGAVAPADRDILRFRWTGTPVVGAALGDPGGTTTLEGSAWVSNHLNLVPGSIVANLPSGGQLRDDGLGRLVGSDGDGYGVVDYQTGAFKLIFYQAETGNVTVDYEHDCAYEALDLHLAWDALMQ